jgi:hypothetical protein
MLGIRDVYPRFILDPGLIRDPGYRGRKGAVSGSSTLILTQTKWFKTYQNYRTLLVFQDSESVIFLYRIPDTMVPKSQYSGSRSAFLVYFGT